MTRVPSYEEGLELLKKYNKDEFHIEHGITVGEVMGYFSKIYDPDNYDYWRIVGLLHDIDFEEYPDLHCKKCIEILEEENIDKSIIRSIVSHGYLSCQEDTPPEKTMEKVLYAVDELTGIIYAAKLMRPSKSTLDMNLKSVKKKFKDKKFAAGCHRDVIIRGAEMLDMDIDDLILETLKAMQEMEENNIN